MNGFSAAAASSSSPIPPPNPTPETSRPSVTLPTTRPEFSSFKFKNIGQPPTLLLRFSDAGAAVDYRSPSPEQSDMDIVSAEDPTMMAIESHHTLHPSPRKSLLEMLGGTADYSGHNPNFTTSQTPDPGGYEPPATSPLATSSSNQVFPRPESRLSSISRQLSTTVDVSRADALSLASVALDAHTYETPDSDMIDLYADPDSPSRSPLSLFSDLSEAVRESAELDRITNLHRILTAEREELLARHDETTRAVSRTKAQLDRVLSLTDEAIKTTTVFVDKEKARLDTKKAKVEGEIERRKNLETERRKAKELERIRHQEEERKARVEMEQQAERQRLEEQRKKEEALAAERQRQEDAQARERAEAEERRRLEEEERQRLAEEDRKKRDEEERKRQAEELQKEEEERLRRRLAEEKEAHARKQEEDRRSQLLERRRQAEEERRRKEAEAAAAKAEAERQEKEQRRLFQERRATVLRDKYKDYNNPESGAPLTASSSTLEGVTSSNLPSIIINGTPNTTQAIAEQHPGIPKIYRARDTPTFVPASTEAGRLPADLSQQVKVSDRLVDRIVKHETISPVITPLDNDHSMEDTTPTQFPLRSVSSTSTSTPTLAPPLLPAPSHLPAKPVTIYSQPPVPLQKNGRDPRHHHPRSRSRSPPPRRPSPSPWIPPRTSRSPDTTRGKHQSPPGRRSDHYSPPRVPYREGGSRYRDSRDSPPPPPPNPLKRTLQDSWVSASTPSKLDYSHPAKRRAVSPPRSPSPPPVTSTRRPPQPIRRGKGGGSTGHVPLEQRLSRPQQLSERIQ